MRKAQYFCQTFRVPLYPVLKNIHKHYCTFSASGAANLLIDWKARGIPNQTFTKKIK